MPYTPTLWIPDATDSVPGRVSIGTQTIGGSKTFSSSLVAAGVYTNNGTIGISGSGIAMTLTSSPTDGGTAVGFTLKTSPLVNATSKLVSFQNNSVEKFYVDKDGYTYANDVFNSKCVYATTADISLYVDIVNGLDTNRGTIGAPFKTINKALSVVPLIMLHNVIINIAAGTYTETLVMPFVNSVSANKTLTLLGTFVQFTPVTGAATGTFTSNDGLNVYTLTGANWTINGLVGHFVKITSGTYIGYYMPVISNTSDTITVAGRGSAVGNCSFEFWDSGVTLSANLSIRVTPMNINFTGLNFTGSVVTRNTGVTSIYYCKSTLTGSLNCIYSYAGSTTITGCLLSCGAACIALSEAMGAVPYVYITNTYAVTTSTSQGAVSMTAYCAIYLGQGIVLSGTYCGLLSSGVNNSVSVSLYGSLWIKDSGVGILNSGTLCIYGTYGTVNVKINSCVSDGILSTGDGKICIGAMYVSSQTELLISGCGRDGIRLESTGNSIALKATSSISGNVGFGVNMSPYATAPSGFNNLVVASTATMGTNIAGDITLDGATHYTLAQLSGASGSTLVDLSRFNRASYSS